MIKVGGDDPLIVKRTTCKKCAAILEYTPSDVKEQHGTDYSGGADGRQWIDCPRCANEVVLKSW